MENDKTTTVENSKKNVLDKTDSNSTFQLYFLKPFLTGAVGFILFLSVTILLDFIVHIFSGGKEIKIETLTFLIAAVGFVLGFGYKFLDIYKNRT